MLLRCARMSSTDAIIERALAVLARADSLRLELPERGVQIALLDFGGAGPPALLHHATGFCKGALAPLALALRSHYRVFAMDARGHGDSSRPGGEGSYHWAEFARDARAVAGELAAAHGGALALSIGHSFGGAALLGAAAEAPHLFERLVLVDPVVPPPPADDTPERVHRVNRLSEGAMRRRATWENRAEAYTWWSERSLFANFPEEALAFYAADGLRERPSGGVELKCPPEVEAAVFGNSGTLDLPRITAGLGVPTLLLWASRGDFQRETYERLAAGMDAARVETLDAAHLVAMEEPGRVLAAVRRFASPRRPARALR